VAAFFTFDQVEGLSSGLAVFEVVSLLLMSVAPVVESYRKIVFLRHLSYTKTKY
jgi:hypothetical protein